MTAGASKTQVLIAVIGVIGTISVAMIANWDKLSSQSTAQASAPYAGMSPAPAASSPQPGRPAFDQPMPAPALSSPPAEASSDSWVKTELARTAAEINRAAGGAIGPDFVFQGAKSDGNSLFLSFAVNADSSPQVAAGVAKLLASSAQVCDKTSSFNLIMRGATFNYEIVDRNGVRIGATTVSTCP